MPPVPVSYRRLRKIAATLSYDIAKNEISVFSLSAIPLWATRGALLHGDCIKKGPAPGRAWHRAVLRHPEIRRRRDIVSNTGATFARSRSAGKISRGCQPSPPAWCRPMLEDVALEQVPTRYAAVRVDEVEFSAWRTNAGKHIELADGGNGGAGSGNPGVEHLESPANPADRAVGACCTRLPMRTQLS
jgi:hypothetical protein